MAKDAQIMTSRWLLLVAAGLAVVAAIAVNLYISSVTSSVTSNSFEVVQVTKDIPLNGKVTYDDVRLVPVPKYFEPAFKQAFKSEADRGWFIGGKPTRRKLNADDILFHGDFVDVQPGVEPVRPPTGTEYVALPIDRSSSPGTQLQPGGWVSVRGRFVVNPGDKDKLWSAMTVYDYIQVKTLDDSPVPLPASSSGYSRIGVFVKKDQARVLPDIIKTAEGQKLVIGITTPGSNKDPEIDPALLKLIQGKRGPAEPDMLPE